MTSQLDSRNHESSVSDIYAEGLRYFMGEGQLNNTLTRLSADLKQHGIDYMVIGAVALVSGKVRKAAGNGA